MTCTIERNNTQVTFMGTTLDITSQTDRYIMLTDGFGQWELCLVDNVLVEPCGFEHKVKVVRRDHVRNWTGRR